MTISVVISSPVIIIFCISIFAKGFSSYSTYFANRRNIIMRERKISLSAFHYDTMCLPIRLTLQKSIDFFEKNY